MVFEDGWRYWWDDAKQDFVHKPEEVLQWELEKGIVHLLPEEVAQRNAWVNGNLVNIEAWLTEADN